MDTSGDSADRADDGPKITDSDDDSTAGQDTASDGDATDGEQGGATGLPPEGEDPMAGAAPSS